MRLLLNDIYGDRMNENENKNEIENETKKENEKFDPKKYEHYRHLRDKLICLYYYKKNTDDIECEMCGEKDIVKLTLNHQDKDRTEDEYSGSAWYSELIKEGLPDKDKYNVLCNSCQLSYQYGRKIYIKDNEKFKYMMDQYINKIKNTDEDLDHVMDIAEIIDEQPLNFDNNVKNGGENGDRK